MQAIILAAGLGTRLRPLTERIAKPALNVLGVPSLWFAAWHLARDLGVSEIAINVGYAPDSLRRVIADKDLSAHTGVCFHLSDESSQILGSSGALWKLKSWIEGGSATKDKEASFAVANGDSISFPSWKRMAEFHRQSGAEMTLHVRVFSKSQSKYTHIEIDSDGKVLALGSHATEGIMFSGSYLCRTRALANLPSGVSALRETLLDPMIARGSLYAFREDCDWIDTGTPAAYAEAQFSLLSRFPKTRELVELKMCEITPGCWVPRSWPDTDGMQLKAPVVLYGENKEDWLKAGHSFGPRFAGIAVPKNLKSYAHHDVLVFSDYIRKL